ncbi:hypothetical protein GCM10025868_23290 [Angustibacter aerolatus]|uniref:Uncharacterized protein n=1 Tax=Angustibacter aerolatus TaxID=1162965 RepID=A0ABQ6JIZ3_9ACTN|nr:hypothetical protein [Angustibacter aerolatus]GMA87079.1 hypothetical protein GCM10025868_23290 [Angustibacter aerolatus]
MTDQPRDPRLAVPEGDEPDLDGPALAVRAALRALPDPGPLPTDVAARLDAALAGLSPADVEAPDDAPPAHRPRTRRSPCCPRCRRGPSGDAGCLAGSPRRRLRWSCSEGGAVAAGVLGGQGGADDSTAAGSAAGSAGAPEIARAAPTAPVLSTGTDYEPGRLATQARDLLSAAAPSADAPSTSQGLRPRDEAATGSPLSTPSGLADCLRQARRRPDERPRRRPRDVPRAPRRRAGAAGADGAGGVGGLARLPHRRRRHAELPAAAVAPPPARPRGPASAEHRSPTMG